MKGVYWRPRSFSASALVLVAAASLLGLFLVESLPSGVRQPHFKEKLEAAQHAQKAFGVIKDEKLKLGIPIDPNTDPTLSGLIGYSSTPVTTNKADLTAKQKSINPNISAIIVEMLLDIGVRPGDIVAVGISGSFPAVNISVYSALHTLGIRPIIISSLTSSEWGANDPELLWIDMESVLQRERLFGYRSRAVSFGGIEDRASGLTKDGQRLLSRAVERNNVPLIKSLSYRDSVKKRMEIYHKEADGRPIKAYINVGGGTASAGKEKFREQFKPGLNVALPENIKPNRSVMASFAAKEIPVLNFANITQVTQMYQLNGDPAVISDVGDGGVFYRSQYNRWLAAGIIVFIVFSHYLIFRSEWGSRFQSILPARDLTDRVEPMI